MGDRYITIPEFANKAGISKRTAYRRIANDLNPYIKIEDGKKMISEAALELFDTKKVEEPEQVVSDTSHSLSIKVTDMAVTEKILDNFARQIAIMEQQLKEKDDQIQQITAALLKEQEIVRQAHMLHAGTMTRIESDRRVTWFDRLFRRKKTNSVSSVSDVSDKH